jgi:hypothetical protein
MILDNNYYRYELKFHSEYSSLQDIKVMVKNNPFLFSENYQQRWVNNIYFDTLELSNYYDSIMGINKKIKVRIRWYGQLFSLIEKPILELKKKVGIVGKKELFILPTFVMDTHTDINPFKQLLQNSKLPETIKYFMKELSPVLFIRYKRRYYRSANKNFRITIDNELSFSGYNFKSHSILNKYSDDSQIILELKYKHTLHDYAHMITNYFPFRITKFSKYVMCMNKTLNV